MNPRSSWIWAGIWAAWLFSISGCGLFVENIPQGQILAETPQDHFITVDGVRYHYVEYPGKGEDVFLLHGFAACTYTWEKVAGYLNRQGYHVWALDMKGFGWSDKPGGARYDPYTLMEEVNRWMGAVGVDQVVFVGNSLGGTIAWLMGLEHPERVSRLVLVDAAGYPIEKPFIIRMAGTPLADPIARLFFCPAIVRWTLEQLYYHDDWITDEQVMAYFDRLRTQNALNAQVAVAGSLKASLFEEYIRRIPTIDKETLLIWGRDDKWIPLDKVGYRFRKDLLNSRLAVIAGCGHIPQEEYPEKTARLIMDFIEGRPIAEYPVPADENY